MAKKVHYPMWIRREDKQFIQYPCHLSRNDLLVNGINDKALAETLTENIGSLSLSFQLCGEAASCSFKITAEDVIQVNILLFATRQNCLISKKSWWQTLRACKSPLMKRMDIYWFYTYQRKWQAILYNCKNSYEIFTDCHPNTSREIF
jgi:hypothetical protein